MQNQLEMLSHGIAVQLQMELNCDKREINGRFSQASVQSFESRGGGRFVEPGMLVLPVVAGPSHTNFQNFSATPVQPHRQRPSHHWSSSVALRCTFARASDGGGSLI